MRGSETSRRFSWARRLFVLTSLAATLPVAAAADDAGEAAPDSGGGRYPPRDLPARRLPVPGTVSGQLQAAIAAPYPPGWNDVPQTAAAWRTLAEQSARDVMPFVQEIREGFRLKIEERRIAGVHVYVITPPEIPEANRDRVLMHLHGGGFVLYPGEAGAGEGMLMAGFGGFKVVSVDYRMAPDHPFPAALDDALAVWRALLADTDPRRMGVFGSSAGGGLTLSLMLRAKKEGLPLPAAIAPGTPFADLTWAGDSMQANAYVDNVLVAKSGWASAAGDLYAAGQDPRDPLLSPLHGDFAGLPPAILTSGTRDLFLSDTVRTHRKLRAAGVEALLQVFEGQSHAQFLDHRIPETRQAFSEIAAFLDARLAR